MNTSRTAAYALPVAMFFGGLASMLSAEAMAPSFSVAEATENDGLRESHFATVC